MSENGPGLMDVVLKSDGFIPLTGLAVEKIDRVDGVTQRMYERATLGQDTYADFLKKNAVRIRTQLKDWYRTATTVDEDLAIQQLTKDKKAVGDFYDLVTVRVTTRVAEGATTRRELRGVELHPMYFIPVERDQIAESLDWNGISQLGARVLNECAISIYSMNCKLKDPKGRPDTNLNAEIIQLSYGLVNLNDESTFKGETVHLVDRIWSEESARLLRLNERQTRAQIRHAAHLERLRIKDAYVGGGASGKG